MIRLSKEQKQAEAKARAEKWRSLTPQEKWAVLDTRLGINEGAKKERAALIAICPELNPIAVQAIKKIENKLPDPSKKEKKIIPNGARIILK
jgi:hypothetical protein